MRRFSALQISLLAFGLGLVFAGIFFKQILRGWEDYRYPNAVYWQGMRVVPGANQQIIAAGTDMLVVKIVKGPMARLTLFLRPDDKLTPQAMVRDLCRRDGCIRSTIAAEYADRAVATYRINGESMQIVLMRLGGGAVWVEYKGPPEALAGFDPLIESVATQLSDRQAAGPG
jgi:hypothetical protein